LKCVDFGEGAMAGHRSVFSTFAWLRLNGWRGCVT
jgi:hypothetical protein